jgi:hypothetical protein
MHNSQDELPSPVKERQRHLLSALFLPEPPLVVPEHPDQSPFFIYK